MRDKIEDAFARPRSFVDTALLALALGVVVIAYPRGLAPLLAGALASRPLGWFIRRRRIARRMPGGARRWCATRTSEPALVCHDVAGLALCLVAIAHAPLGAPSTAATFLAATAAGLLLRRWPVPKDRPPHLTRAARLPARLVTVLWVAVMMVAVALVPAEPGAPPATKVHLRAETLGPLPLPLHVCAPATLRPERDAADGRPLVEGDVVELLSLSADGLADVRHDGRRGFMAADVLVTMRCGVVVHDPPRRDDDGFLMLRVAAGVPMSVCRDADVLAEPRDGAPVMARVPAGAGVVVVVGFNAAGFAWVHAGTDFAYVSSETLVPGPCWMGEPADS